eukprot:4661179-Pyramimonas_sp.AAC.1
MSLSIFTYRVRWKDWLLILLRLLGPTPCRQIESGQNALDTRTKNGCAGKDNPSIVNPKVSRSAQTGWPATKGQEYKGLATRANAMATCGLEALLLGVGARSSCALPTRADEHARPDPSTPSPPGGSCPASKKR